MIRGTFQVLSYLLVALAAALVPSRAQVEFTDASGLRGIEAYAGSAMGGGVAAADFDDDGDIDLFVPNQGGADQLYRNLGSGQFEEIAAPRASTPPPTTGQRCGSTTMATRIWI